MHLPTMSPLKRVYMSCALVITTAVTHNHIAFFGERTVVTAMVRYVAQYKVMQHRHAVRVLLFQYITLDFGCLTEMLDGDISRQSARASQTGRTSCSNQSARASHIRVNITEPIS